MAEAEGHGGPPSTDSVLFILVCFSIGIFIKLCLQWTRVPYTAMLLISGLGVGFLQLAHPATQAFTNTLQLWLSMEPHLLLLIFLPIIGFSAAIAQEPHMLRKSWGQIMLLAWPGVVIQFLLIAICAKYFFPYGWSWPESFLFGAMMSATDPVAVVAVLQEVGASQKLACVIDGESLMNDGSALVIFLILQSIVEGAAITVSGAISKFCLLAVVGMLLGIAFGAGTSFLLSHIFRDPTLTTVVTLLSAYASYYTADGLVGASGLLAVVCNGFTMSLIGGRQIALRAEEAMHACWSVLEWGANTILFVWMGIMLAVVLPPSHADTAFTDHPIILVASDAGYVIVLYLWLQIARLLLVLVCWVPFNYTGYPLNWRTATVFVWGGLRGAVGMVMALFIFLDTKIHNDSFKSYCIFYMGTMAFITVLVNGGTTKALLNRLGFMSYTPEQLGTLTHVVEDMEVIRDKQLGQLQPDEVLGEPEPLVVKVWSQLPTARVLHKAAANTVRPLIDRHSPAVQAAIEAGLEPSLLYDFRCRMLHMVKTHYAEVYNKHMLSTMQMRTLQGATDAALDKAACGLQDWHILEPSCRLHGLPKLLHKIQLQRLSPVLLQWATYSQQLGNLQLLVAFIHAHRHAQDVLRQHIQAVASGSSQASQPAPPSKHLPASPADFADMLADLPAGTRAVAEALFVLQESEAEAAAALEVAEALSSSHPSLPAWLRSKQVAVEILTEQQDFLQDLAAAGLIQQRELLMLDDLMHNQFRNLLRGNSGFSAALHYSTSKPPLNCLPLFDCLSDSQVAQLLRHGPATTDPRTPSMAAHSGDLPALNVRWKVCYPEHVMALPDTPVDQIFVITKGAVRMRFPVVTGPHARTQEHVVVASVGDALGVCELMLGLPRMSELTADSLVQVLVVPASSFLQLLTVEPGVRTRAWQATGAQLAAQHHHILGVHRQLAPLNMFFKSCTVDRVAPGEVFEVPRTALLLTGQVKALLPLPAEFALSRGLSGPVPASALAGGSSSSSSLDDLQGSSPKSSASGSSALSPRHGAAAPGTSTLLHLVSLRGDLAGGSPRKNAQRLLSAPSELPPIEFRCVTEAILLQVPRGPEMPSHLETLSYQSQVLGRGSIKAGASWGRQLQALPGKAPLAVSGLQRAPSSDSQSGAAASAAAPAGSGSGMELVPSRPQPLQRMASDTVPVMGLLQGALRQQRWQQHRHEALPGSSPPLAINRTGSGGSGGIHNRGALPPHAPSPLPPAAAAAAAAGFGSGSKQGLHTVIEVHAPPHDASAAANGAGGSSAQHTLGSTAAVTSRTGGNAGLLSSSPFSAAAVDGRSGSSSNSLPQAGQRNSSTPVAVPGQQQQQQLPAALSAGGVVSPGSEAAAVELPRATQPLLQKRPSVGRQSL